MTDPKPYRLPVVSIQHLAGNIAPALDAISSENRDGFKHTHPPLLVRRVFQGNTIRTFGPVSVYPCLTGRSLTAITLDLPAAQAVAVGATEVLVLGGWVRSNAVIEEALVKRLAIEASAETLLFAGHSKFG
ncbi:hypothetical protein [Deinococcus sp. Arct2-2]|uniref:hypothetical protein n=1 Tax=Deinococcus sp. Arct2-2 TaxID=2568653 RepID=UPI00197AF9A7|nr:hypothetical protein [Deinococcus sp. Arct2-2]